MTGLSVVLISKNQAWNTARLVESVLKETERLPAREVVLVDSASTDRTTEVAARYPIAVLRLRPDQRLTPAAGRYVGYAQTTGDLVLFLDGDMELCEGWLEQALDVMGSQPDVAVITGRVIDRPLHAAEPAGDIAARGVGDAVDVPHGGGAAMYRRSVLEQVGTFNPYLYSDEEPVLCLAIRHAGHRVIRLARPIVFHYSAPVEAFSTLLGKRSRKFFLGFGQNLRYFYGSPLFWPYLRERGWAAAPAVMILAGLVALAASWLAGQWAWLALWVLGLLFLVITITIRKRSLSRALFAIFGKMLILEGTVRGLSIAPLDPTGYLASYDVVR
jgi:glycosyltransferase involved in cell wall biosynthesis